MPDKRLFYCSIREQIALLWQLPKRPTMAIIQSQISYGLPVRFEASQFTSARWIKGEKAIIDKFVASNKEHMATDNDGDSVYLTRLQWDIDRVERDFPDLKLTSTKEMMM